MTEATAEPRNLRSRMLPTLFLAGIVVAYIATNLLMLRVSNQVRRPPEYLEALTVGIVVFEPISIGIWTALASGAFITRLPMALLCLSFLVLSFAVADSNSGGLERTDFFALALSGVIIFALTTLIFLVIRWLTRFHIESLQSAGLAGKSHVRFSMKYLLALTTLAAVSLGTFSQLEFKEPPRQPFFGPEFTYYVNIVGGAIIAGISLPVIAVPWFILSRRISQRAVVVAITFWIVVALIVILICAINEVDEWPEIMSFCLLEQLAAAIAGLFTALPLRLAGLRLVRGYSTDASQAAATGSTAIQTEPLVNRRTTL